MRLRSVGYCATAALAVLLILDCGTASACHKCIKTPCVMVAAPAPLPAYQCVTEMVPQTVYRTRTKTEYRPVTQTIMTRVAETTYTERLRVVCKPVWETSTVQQTVTTCRPVSETTSVTQSFTVCKPVSTTQQVTEYVMQASTRLVTVPVMASKCGHCGHPKISCGCVTMAQTCYTPVPVVKNVVVTQMVAEVQTRQIPVVTTRMVSETKVVNVPVRTCKMVQSVVTDRIPCVTFHCVPKTITRNVPYPVCETIAEVKYHPVTRMVPITYAAPQAAPVATPQTSPQVSSQASGLGNATKGGSFTMLGD